MAHATPARSAAPSSNVTPRYARPAAAARYLGVARPTLYEWSRTRPGFPKPMKAGPRVSLFNLADIDAFLAGSAA